MTRTEYQELVKQAAQGTLPDEQNPCFILSNVSLELLKRIAEGTIDLQALAQIELENRGK